MRPPSSAQRTASYTAPVPMRPDNDGANVLMIVAPAIVAGAGTFLVGMAAVTVLARRQAERFLAAFASSARAHVTEQLVRLIVGGALVVHAPHMRLPLFFGTFGWVLIVTSAGLLLIPWQWHRTFARRAIPLVIRHLRLYGLGAFVLGVFILAAMT